MITIKSFTFNPFQENMYVLSDETGACIIIDPGCYDATDQQTLSAYISNNNLKPVRLLNTHCHIDHVFGNAYVCSKFGLELEAHREEVQVLAYSKQAASIYGVNYEESPQPSSFLDEGDQIKFGNSTLDILFVPGHAPGHLAFVSHADRFVINGDVLFAGSVGRWDLPGGDFETLKASIQNKMYALPDDYTVYAGHGPATTIGTEKVSNGVVRPGS